MLPGSTSASRELPRMIAIAFLTAAVVLWAPAASSSSATRWTVADLGLGADSSATSVNDAGQVVGTFVVGSRYHEKFHVFLWQNGKAQDLGTGVDAYLNERGEVAIDDDGHVRLWQNGRSIDIGSLGPYRTVARDINARGEIVGWSGTRAHRQHAFLWSNGRMTDVGGHGLAASEAVAINDAGQVIGWRHAPRRANLTQYRALLWANGRETDLGVVSGQGGSTPIAITTEGAVAGTSTIRPHERHHGFLWVRGRLTDLGDIGDESFVVPHGLNDRLQVIGNGVVADARGSNHAFLWQSGKMRDLGALPGDLQSDAVAINATGLVVGTSTTLETDIAHPVVWRDGGIAELPSLAKDRDGAPLAVNSRGMIVGSSDRRAVVWLPR